MTTKVSGTHWSIEGVIAKFRKTFNYRSMGNEDGAVALGKGKLIEIADGATFASYKADNGIEVFIDEQRAPQSSIFNEGQKFRATIAGGGQITGEYSLPKTARK